MATDLQSALPLGFQGWMPIWQASFLALMTFVQEDVPTFAAAWLTAAGAMTWKAGLGGCFLGIWIGDALLYLIARCVGRPLMNQRWAKRWISASAVSQSETWFHSKGAWLLISSRFIPGTRLPTYLAAGFLRLPFWKFLIITGSAVAAWTLAIFLLAHWAGDPLQAQWNRFQHTGTLLVGVAVSIVIFRYGMRRLAGAGSEMIQAAKGWLQRWEFWPPWMFYPPVAVYYLQLAIRHRSLTLPTLSNPGIQHGGFVGESKFETLRQLQRIAPELTAETHHLPVGPTTERLQLVRQILERNQISCPFILKPDQGQRGIGVKVIREMSQANEYLQQTQAALVLQRYAAGPEEIGVFYIRKPSSPRGRIFAVTRKRFPHVIGDGKTSLRNLILLDPRARWLAEVYFAKLGERLTQIPEEGERIILVETGNHAQGCIFEDGMDLATSGLESRIDELSQKLDGFYFGRYDIRYESDEALRSGAPFQIVELNGATAEATSIYDARNSLRSAYRTLFEQWRIAFEIGSENRKCGHRPSSLSELWKCWRSARRMARDYPIAD